MDYMEMKTIEEQVQEIMKPYYVAHINDICSCKINKIPCLFKLFSVGEVHNFEILEMHKKKEVVND